MISLRVNDGVLNITHKAIATPFSDKKLARQSTLSPIQ